MKAKPLPPVERVRYLLDYCPESGVFACKVTQNQLSKVGDIAGYTRKDGYVDIRIDGTSYLAHRLAWLHYYGTEPTVDLDHINGNPSDNRIANLREVTHQQNMMNRKTNSNTTTGCKGVRKHKGKFEARIQFGGRRYYIGSFDTIAEASTHYEGAAQLLYGEYTRSKKGSAANAAPTNQTQTLKGVSKL